MPCAFDYTNRASGESWRSASANLTPASDQHFHVLTNNMGGGCGHCRATQRGVAWGSDHYVLCLACAVTFFGAPDLRLMAPELFDPIAATEENDEDYEDPPEAITTKRDKDFDPRKYQRFTHGSPLSNRNGCSGYKCATYPAPERTIPSGTWFMLGEGDRGHLCVSCFNKLKLKYESMPAAEECSYCDRRTHSSRMVQTCNVAHPRVCGGCIREYYMTAPETDGGYILRERCVFSYYPPLQEGGSPRRVYASLDWARAHWFAGRDNVWYRTQEQADAELFSVDMLYQADRITRNAQSSIFPYGTNVIKMHGFPSVTSKDSLCLGVELEMQPNRNHTHTQVVAALGGKFVASRPYILCADSSLGPGGVEMITLPYTLANHRADKFMPWTKVLADLRLVAMSGAGTTNCGMHVHINRRALSSLQMGKMLLVINAPEMQELIVTIAQRSDTSYARRYVKKVAEGGKIIGSHGDALNMSNSKGTCELRIFRGNLRYERVMKNLEFAEALCLYAGEQSIQRVHDPAELLTWLQDNRAHYPHLVKFLKEEYRPTKAFERTAARCRKEGSWETAPGHVNVETIEGDI